MPRKLKKLTITAVALCKQGANPDAHIMLYKSLDKGGNTMKTLEEILKSLPAEEQETVNKAIEDAKKAMPEDKQKEMDALDEDKKKLEKSVEELEKSLEATKVSKSAKDAEEEMLKSVPEAVRKMFEQTKADAEAAKAIAKAMQEEKINKSFIEKVSVYKSLPAKADELGPILKAVSQADEKLGTQLEGILKATNELVEKGAAFKELGDNQGGSASDALAQLEKHVNEIVVKNTSMTKEQAYAKALELHPDLYDAYVKSLNDEE